MVDTICELDAAAKGQEFVLTTDRTDLLDEWLDAIFADATSA
jgi:hypothetical protein